MRAPPTALLRSFGNFNVHFSQTLFSLVRPPAMNYLVLKNCRIKLKEITFTDL